MHTLFKGFAIASLCYAGFVAYDATQDEKKQDMGAMPTPTEEHKWLAEGAGKWKATGKMNMGGTWAPMNGVQTNTMQHGGFWQVIDFKSDDGSFVGHGVAGYDPAKKKFTSVWVDNWTTELPVAEGTLSADKKTLTMKMMRADQTGKKSEVTETTTRKDKDTSTFEMTGTGPDGKPTKFLEITYTRM